MDEGMRPEEARPRFHGDPGDEQIPPIEPKIIEQTEDQIMWLDENGLHLERCSDWMRRTNRNA